MARGNISESMLTELSFQGLGKVVHGRDLEISLGEVVSLGVILECKLMKSSRRVMLIIVLQLEKYSDRSCLYIIYCNQKFLFLGVTPSSASRQLFIFRITLGRAEGAGIESRSWNPGQHAETAFPSALALWRLNFSFFKLVSKHFKNQAGLLFQSSLLSLIEHQKPLSTDNFLLSTTCQTLSSIFSLA